METKKRIIDRKLIALLTMFMILIDMFSPLGVIFAETTPPVDGKPYITVKLHSIQDSNTDLDNMDDDTANYYFEYANGYVDNVDESTKHMVTIDLIMSGNLANTSNAFAASMKYDSSILIPGVIEETRKR